MRSLTSSTRWRETLLILDLAPSQPWAAVACLIGIGLGAGMPAMAQMPATRVVVAEAQLREAPTTVTLVGTLQPLRRSRVGTEIGGLILDMPIRQGDFVESGQLICRLSSDLAELRLAEAVARHAALKAVHEELVAGTREEEKRRLQALLMEAEARVVRWKFEKERVEKLYSGSEAGSAKEVYDAAAEYEMAVQRRQAAQAAYDEALKGPRQETIARAAQEVVEQQAVVDRLRRELDKTMIKAPFAGAIVDRRVEVGEWVQTGGEVAELADLGSVLVRVDLPESAMPSVRARDAASVIVDALNRTFEGRVRHVIPQANEQARTFPVEVEVANPDGVLAAGMFARTVLTCGASSQVVCVPKDAVLMRDGTNYVATVVPGQQGGLMGMPQAVTIGASVGEWIAITSGNVAAGAKVIVRGNERIAFPMPVEVVDASGSPVKVDLTLPPSARDGVTDGVEGKQPPASGPAASASRGEGR